MTSDCIIILHPCFDFASVGSSATVAFAYRVAERIEDRRTGLTFDYAARG
jgi:hypothetical protein